MSERQFRVLTQAHTESSPMVFGIKVNERRTILGS
jgi:hypothetical protein